MHNPDGSRTVCRGNDRNDCRTITDKNQIKVIWGADPLTVGPYPAKNVSYLAQAKVRPEFKDPMKEKAYDEARNANYNPFDGLVHNVDGTKTTWLDDEVVGGINTGAWI
jgi:hypothetical protein